MLFNFVIKDLEKMLTGKILGIDYGEKRLGVAVSDIFGWTARAVTTIEYSSEEQLFQRLEEIIKEEEAKEIVIGIPTRTDGSKSEKALVIEKFCERLKKRIDLPLYFTDESYTSKEAQKILYSRGKKLKKNKKQIDSIAAELILKSYLREKGY